MWWSYVIGYAFSILAGHLFIKLAVDEMHRGLGEEKRLFAWHPAALGCLERTLYTVSWNFEKPEFIAVWLALKVAGQWKRWTEDQPIGENVIPGRSIYNVFLIGSGLSILYASTGAMIPEWLKEGNWHVAVAVPLALIAGSVILWFWARSQATSSNSG